MRRRCGDVSSLLSMGEVEEDVAHSGVDPPIQNVHGSDPSALQQ